MTRFFRLTLMGFSLAMLTMLTMLALTGCGNDAASPNAAQTNSSTEAKTPQAAEASDTAPSSGLETSDQYVLVFLDANAAAGHHWEYTMDPEGVAVELDLNDLPEAVENPDGTVTFQNYVIPGTQTLAFASWKPGEVTVNFRMVDLEGNAVPGGVATYKLLVKDNMSIEVIESEVRYPY